ncbi:MAG: hypothetical protein ACRBFS_10090 [Aureispira sp.]
MKQSVLLLTTALALLAALAYEIPRTDFTTFISCYAALFTVYGIWIYRAPKTFKAEHWRYYLGGALLLRLVFGAALPELSDDFWRYLWDGRLLSHGINPYQYVPSALLEQPIYEQAHLAQLYPYLNSPDYYSVYPPLTQLLFATATYCFPANVAGSVLLLRLLIVVLEMGTIVLLLRYLKQNNKAPYLAFVYAFNPMIIVELSGNLHTESLMLFFLILLLYFWSKKQYYRSAFACSLAVAAKLIPLMLLPLLCWRLWFKKGVIYATIVGVVNVVLFAAFYDLEMILKIRESMGLYFQHFEFNASVYYFFRYQVLDEYWLLWDYHEYFMDVYYLEEALRLDWFVLLRRFLPIATVIGILGIAFRHYSTASVANGCLWIFALYFFFGTTVHPWYISSLVLFAVLTNYRFPLLWSALLGGTYISYQGGVFEEQTWVIVIEYVLLIAALCWELFDRKRSPKEEEFSTAQKTIRSTVESSTL